MMARIPEFRNEREEREFWDEHDAADYLDDTEEVEVEVVDARPRKRPISIRLEPETIDCLKAVAARRGIGYQTLIRMWVREKLDDEAT